MSKSTPFQIKLFSQLFSVILIIFIFSCQSESNNSKENNTSETTEQQEYIDILTELMDFQMQDTIPSGWNTFRYKNASPQTHFFVIEKYPEGKSAKDAEEVIAPVFDKAMSLIRGGKPKEGFAEFQHLPEWFNEVVFTGGSGLISPNSVSTTTVHLDPGNYVLECYLKMSNGVFHTSMGMVKDIVVAEESSGKEEPTADVSINVSGESRLKINNTITTGEHTFAVTFDDQKTHENFVGHDVHLARLSQTAEMSELVEWMNWAAPDGLMDPSPRGISFLGGVNDMPAGSTGYFTAYLQPGTYAFISEVPKVQEKNLIQIVEITE